MKISFLLIQNYNFGKTKIFYLEFKIIYPGKISKKYYIIKF